ncbi:MAG: PAS domain-containing protein, partial [Halolamina sp.]
MTDGHAPHVVVADGLPPAVGTAESVCDRLRDAGLVASRADAPERAASRLRDGRGDVLVVPEEAGELVATAAELDVPCCVVGDDAESGAESSVVSIRPSGPDPVARLAGTVHELAATGRTETALTETTERQTGDGTPLSTARILDEAPVGVTISDMTQPDEPLVYVNDQFVEQTGYSREEAVGRNCRFLQGPATAAEPVNRMRAAINAGEAVTVELRNYRQNGDLFWQEVSLAPIRDDSGRVTHYAGFQSEATRRKRAERAANRHRAALAEERETLRGLLHRLDGVVEQITGAVVEADSRSTLGETVCSRLGRSYAAAWLA